MGNGVSEGSVSRRRQLGAALPHEGDNGLFSESWFPICLSGEIPAGKILGVDFLDGRVVAYRGASGEARVMSAYCSHLGADLAVGDIQDDTIRCAFHHWRYDGRGVCVATKIGDPPPPAACLFKFPVCERYGIVFAYNGEHPRFEIPVFPYPESDLLIDTIAYAETVPIDPWVLSCNTPDMQHIKALHNISIDGGDPHDAVEWTDHSMLYNFKGHHALGQPIQYRVGIYGNNIFYQSGTIEGRWFGFTTPMALPRPGVTRLYAVTAVRKSEGDETSNAAFLRSVVELETNVVAEDIPVINGIHFRPGTLTKSDRTLARFFQYLREYPRCHPSAEFIN